MTVSKDDTPSTWTDPDDAPELTDAWFEKATFRVGHTVVRSGRPKGSGTKRPVSIRIDQDVLDHFRSGGPGWQSRMNAALRKAAGIA